VKDSIDMHSRSTDICCSSVHIEHIEHKADHIRLSAIGSFPVSKCTHTGT